MATLSPSLKISSVKLTKPTTSTCFYDPNKEIHTQMDMLGRNRVYKQCSQGVTRNAHQDRVFKVFTSTQRSAYQVGQELYTSTEVEELENASTYLFRTEIGGQVKVYIGRKNIKYVVYIEVSSLSQWSDTNELVLSWGMFRSNSSSLMPLDPQSSVPGARSNTTQTQFTQKSLGRLALEMEFDLNQAPFYLSFLLHSVSDAATSNLEIRSHRHVDFCVPVGINSGYPAPLGVSFSDDGSVNFALFSRNAESVILCLYDEMADEPSLELDLDPYINRTGDVWHVSMESIEPYVSYAYRCKGEQCHAGNVVLDPYAKILTSFLPDHPGSVSLAKYFGSLSKVPTFDWSGEARPSLPMENLVVYRLNVERFTKDKSSQLLTAVAGTFPGLIEKLHHFKTLSVNAILLEPIFSFDEKKGPYFPFHFFSPMNIYGPTCDGVSSINSMKEMVKTLHANNIEVLLEVVFTHTSEDGDSASQTISLQGIDNSSYYVSDKGVESQARSTLNCNNPVVQQLVLDSLRYWVTEFHIDGFCFINSSSFLKGSNGEYLDRPPLVEAIAFDPVLSKTKIIADCWDPYDTFPKEIHFPHWKRWAEMNTRFCHDIRNFLRGEGLLSNLATRLCGSGDIFLDGRGPAFSFNFIASNFGLPLVDLVSFSGSKLSSQLSWNCGEEGPTNKNVVLERRLKQVRNFLFILYISLGVPVLNMGDECGQSSYGLPSYGDRKSFDWDALRTGFGAQMTQFIAFLISLRVRRSDVLRKRNFMLEDNIDWHGNDQALPKWEDPSSKFLAVTLKVDGEEVESSSESSRKWGDLFIAFNAGDHSESVILPPPSEGMEWFRLIDTALPFPAFFLIDGNPVIEDMEGLVVYEMKSHSCALFEARSLQLAETLL